MRGNKLLSFAVAGALCCSLAGCAGGQKDSDGTEQAGQSNEKKHITINVKSPAMATPFDAEHENAEIMDMLKEAGEAFCATYEDADVTINYTKFQYVDESAETIGKAGTADAADVVFAGQFNVPTYITEGYAVPLDDVIDDALRADIDDAIWQQCMTDGKTYVLPYYQLQNTLVVNADIMRAAGLERFLTTDGSVAQWSTDEFNEILQTLKASSADESTYPLALWAANNQGDTHTLSLLRAYGSTIYDDEGRFNLSTPEGIAALSWMKDLDDQGIVPKGAENMELANVIELFYHGQLALCPGNQTQLLVDRPADFEPMLANFPTLDGKGCATTFLTGFTVFDNDDADRIRVAKDFVRYLYTSDDYLRYSAAGVPLSKSYLERNGDTMEGAAVIEAFANNSPQVVDFLNNTPNWSGVREAFYPNIQDLLRGTKTPEEVAAAIDESCNAAIDEGRGKAADAS